MCGTATRKHKSSSVVRQWKVKVESTTCLSLLNIRSAVVIHHYTNQDFLRYWLKAGVAER